MEDIVPQLIADVTEEFHKLYDGSSKIQTLLGKVKQGTATYADAQKYALEVARLIGLAYEKYVSSATLPDGRMYYNIASRLIPSTLDENYRLVADYTEAVQKGLNEKAGLGIKAQRAQLEQDRVDGLVELAAGTEQYDEVGGKMARAMETYLQSIVDESVRSNVNFQGKAGMTPVVYRRSIGRCCDWCRALVGKYEYPDVPKDVYRRHENCRCTVEYDPGDGRRQNVHTKRWTDDNDDDILEARKRFNLLLNDARRYEPDIIIPQSVGAKAKDILVTLPTGEQIRVTPGTRITHVQTIAGLGRNRQIDIIDRLLDVYPGTDALKWQKKKGIGYVDYEGESYKAELHWYEEPSVGRVEFKIKPDADGNWFYED